MNRIRTDRIVAGSSALVSTGASSLTGLLVNVAAATTRNDIDFGHFSIVYLVVLGIMTLLRAISGEVILFTDSSASLGAARHNSMVTVAAMSAVGALVLAALGATLDAVGYAAALALIPVCVQDNYRYLAFVARRTDVAAISDVVTASGPVALVLFGTGRADAGPAAFLVWGGAAIAGSLVAERLLRPGHGLKVRTMFSREIQPLRRASLVEFLSTTLLYQIPLLALPFVVTYAAVGTMRGLQMMYSPVTILHAAMFALVVPRLTRAYEVTGQVRYALIMVYVATLSSLVALIALVVWRVPGSLMERALGDIGSSVQENAWEYASLQAVAVVAAAATVTHRIDRTYQSIVGVRVASSMTAPILCLVGAYFYGVPGACFGLAASQLFYFALLRSPLVQQRLAMRT